MQIRKNGASVFDKVFGFFALLPAVALAEPVDLKAPSQDAAALRAVAYDPQVRGETIVWYGLLELEAIAHRGYTAMEDNQDIAVATVELGVDVALDPNLATSLVFLYEEDEGGFDLDQAVLSMSVSDQLVLNLGQMYLPFGRFETALVQDSLALELGEIVETAIEAEYRLGDYALAGYLFNGDAKKLDEQGERVNSFGFRFGQTRAGGSDSRYESIGWGIDYLNNIADTDGLSAAVTLPVQDRDDAVSAYLFVSTNKMTFSGEYLVLLSELDNGHKPSVLHLEAGLATSQVAGYAVGLQLVEEAAFMGLPQRRFSLGHQSPISSAAELGVELYVDNDFALSEGGSGESALGVVANLAVNF